MATLLLIAVGVLTLGIAGSLHLMARSGEIRVGLLTLCFAILALRDVVVLWHSWNAPLALDATGITEISLLAASVAGLAFLPALRRTLAERDRAETLHWDSMQTLRILGELADRSDASLGEKLDDLLRIGCQRLNLDIGVVSRIQDQRYEVIALRAPADCAVSKGSVYRLADTCCARAMGATRVVAFERVAEMARLAWPERAPFGFGAYLGCTVRVYGEVTGTLAFGNADPRRDRFTATDKDLVGLMAQWIGTEIERRFAAEEREANRARRATQAPSLRTVGLAGSLSRSVDVNAAVRRAQHAVRSIVGERAEVVYRLGEDLYAARRLPVSIAALVEGVATHACELLGSGGRLTITTANLAIAQPDDGSLPAAVSDGYVTVSLAASGDDIAARSFADVFEARPGPAGSLPDCMTLAEILRLLQRSGGDLSLAFEPGKAAIFTIYLPRIRGRGGDAAMSSAAARTA